MAARSFTALPSVETAIPARLDRLPWSRFHLLIVVALGVTWILDGLEVTIVGAIGPALQSVKTLNLDPAAIGAAASAYVFGAVGGAVVFGWITDRFGRRLVFFTTLAVYLVGVLLSACSWNFLSFALFRMITGFGIGGEYAAINSAIDELIPAKYRGRIDLMVNGSFWLGAAAGAAASPFLLDPHLLPPNLGWRLGFAIGGVLGLSILLLRGLVPESPRWLVTHGRAEEAETIMVGIEQRVEAHEGQNASAGARPDHRAPPQGVRLWPCAEDHARQAPRPQHPGLDPNDSAGLPLQRPVLHLWYGADEV